ncbi:MAG TPA: hypothetical protein VFN83_06110 [Gemmatimonadales bacterium]|jgi:hypothetical protein|nr:hypothetical protein [Gemmatimonadales bacterium]
MTEPHSAVREGAVAGAIGAATVAIWYFIIDWAHGRPLHTPNVIAQVLLGNGRSDAGEFGTIAVVTVVHFLAYMAVGVALTALVHLSWRNVAWRFGAWLAVVIAFAFFSGLAYALGPLTGEHFPHWTVLGGSVVALLAMGAYLWRLHPELVQSFAAEGFGNDAGGPPHPDVR